MAIKTTIQLRRDTLNNWSSINPVLAKGEIALVDTNNVFGVEGASGSPLWVIRIGDGTSQFNDLPETAYALRSYVDSELSAIDGELSAIREDMDDLTGGDLSHIKSELSTISVDLDTLDVSVERLETALSGEGGITSRVGALETDLTTLTATTIPDLMEGLEGQISDVSDEVTALETSLSNYSVTISEAEESGADKYKYVVKQGGVDIGAIEIPHDVFVDKGEITVIGDETYLLLTLNNDEQTVLSVNATSLVDVYTGLSSDTIDVTVDEFKVMASIKDGSITPEKLSKTETFIFDCGGANLSDSNSEPEA